MLAVFDCLADIVAEEVEIRGSAAIYDAANVVGSSVSVDLSRHGYVETEFLVSGKASAFSKAGGETMPGKTAYEYTTRVVVRRPADWTKFSGIVHFEAAHPSLGSAAHWYVAAPYIVSSGDAYVLAGLGDDARQRKLTAERGYPTSQSTILPWFDARKYERIQWPEEDGIRWQAMGELLAWLRSDAANNPFSEELPEKLVAGGWSFTGSLLRSWINYGFHERYRRADGGPLIDAYFIGISSRWNASGILPLSAGADVPEPQDTSRELKRIDVPVIEFLTEFEVGLGDGPQLPDSDAVAGGHRLYELGGAVHGDQLLLDRGSQPILRPYQVQLAAKGYPFSFIEEYQRHSQCPFPVSDVPLGPLARAALHNLKSWIVDGTPPPRAPQLALGEDGAVLRDKFGNPLGGIPVAEFATPIATYDIYRDQDLPQCVRSGGRPLILRRDLPVGALEALYGSETAYLQRFGDAVDTLVADGWLLSTDAVQLKQSAEQRSMVAFAGK